MRPEGMRRAAVEQAERRAKREGEPCYVYRQGVTWYVRTAAEGAPEGATLEHTTGVQA